MNASEIWSVISTILGVILLVWDFYMLGESKKQKEIFNKEKEIHKSQVKIWQHYANGISNSLLNLDFSIDKDPQSNKNTQQAIKALNTVSFFLYKSLNEERLFSEEEIKQQQIDTQNQYNQILNKQPTSTPPVSN